MYLFIFFQFVYTLILISRVAYPVPQPFAGTKYLNFKSGYKLVEKRSDKAKTTFLVGLLCFKSVTVYCLGLAMLLLLLKG